MGIYHEWELAVNGDMVEQGVAEAWSEGKKLNEEADNDSVDSLICAGRFSNKMVLRGNIP